MQRLRHPKPRHNHLRRNASARIVAYHKKGTPEKALVSLRAFLLLAHPGTLRPNHGSRGLDFLTHLIGAGPIIVPDDF